MVKVVDAVLDGRYQRWAMVASFAIAVVAAVFASAAFPFADRSEAALFLLSNIAVLLGIAYVPPHLQRSPAFLVRSISWQAMARWLVLALALVYWVMFLRPEGGHALSAALGWEALFNVVAAAVGRRHWHAHDFAWTLYFAGDFILLIFATSALEATMSLAMVATISAFLLIVSAGHGPRASVAFVGGLYIGLLYGGMGWLRGYAIAWFVIVGLAAFGLSTLAARAPEKLPAPSVPAPPPVPVESTSPAPRDEGTI